MNNRVPAQQTAAANEARRRRTRDKIERVEDVLKRMRREKIPVTYPAVARRAFVSRTFLYDNAGARALMEDAVTRHADQRQHSQAGCGKADEAWRERALNAEDALKAAHDEIRSQRNRIGQLIGQLRDVEHELPAGTIERISTENAALKQRIRQLTADNRTLEERLQAARSNNRFADRRIAQLEAQATEHAPAP
ncbi:MAG: DUF6262 family protein [Actinomycetota bacterium]|nr:DUF6262 family protein [Actinomycetota bacterium]